MPELSDVVALETITSERANDIRDRTVQRYDNIATRTAENSSPTVGDVAFMEDTGDLDVYFSGAWRHVGAPVAHISVGAAASAAPGWLLCNGQAVSRTTYAALFAAIGTTYGVGDGSTTFNVPDLRQRFPLGVAASGTGNTLGGTGGAIDHVHTGGNHTHNVDPDPVVTSGPSAVDDGLAVSSGIDAADDLHTHTVNIPTTATGNPTAHNTGSANPPFLALHYFIKT